MAFEHLTDEQKEKLNIQYRDELIQKEISYEKKLSPEQKKILEDVRYNDPWGRKKTSLVMDMIRMLSEKYKKPSFVLSIEKDSEGNNIDLPAKLFGELATKYATRVGGYTRMIKKGPRKGDAAEVVILELV